MSSYGDIDPGSRVSSTQVDLSSNMFYGFHLRAISEERLMNLIHNMCSEITHV